MAVPLKKKLGYSAGIFSDTLGYSIFYSYFFTFLTSVVGVGAAAAGTISSIGILWDGVTDPIIGWVADGKPHRRRKMIFAFSIPYAISILCTYIAVDFGSTGNIIYYTICALCFWLFYTMVCVPYYSVIPEVTSDYDERSEYRSFSAFMCTFANLITISGPMLLVGFFGKWVPNSKGGGWTITAALFGVIVILCAFICSRMLKRAEEEQGENAYVPPEREKMSVGKAIVVLFKDFFRVLGEKQVLVLFLTMVACNVFRGFTSTGFTTYMIYCIGWGANQISLCYAVLIGSWVIYFPIVSSLSKKYDRKTVMMVFAVITFVGRVVVGLMPWATTPVGTYVNVFFSNFLTCSYLSLAFAMPYDLCELYEFKHNGERRDSTIQSIPFMAQKIGAAIGAFFWGQATAKAGLDTLAEGFQGKIASAFLVKIDFVILIYLALFLLYKVKRQHVALLQQQNKNRAEGLPVSSEGFEVLLK